MPDERDEPEEVELIPISPCGDHVICSECINREDCGLPTNEAADQRHEQRRGAGYR